MDYEESKTGYLPVDFADGKDYLISCNICGLPLTIHYWVDGDVHVDPCESKECKGDK